ncbi:MAG: glycosyltransferase, partial [Campylobacterales bacterium]|nr:glycosyltransferase [Campylobacterales bacterium]
VKPNEIVLVQDGKLTDDLYTVIGKWKSKLGNILKIIPLEQNVGLGDALNGGIKHCSYELVARMDTDDIALPDRFEKQLKAFEEKDIDVCSGWISEFDKDEEEILSYRKLPELHHEIINFARKRCPINHPAVMYKKAVVEKAGGYQKMMWFEDYYLWGRMIVNGAKFYNLQEVLVNMRAGYAQLERRSGFEYAMSEFNLQKEFLKIGFINSFEFIRNVAIRFSSRVMPKILVKIIYKLLRK